jgi:choline dehydrogenase-like flavoprotein
MYLDANELAAGFTLGGSDICIVGSGAAGISMAARLSSTSRKVLVITSGSRTDRGRPSGVDQSLYEGVLGPFIKKVDPEFLSRSRLRMYGGTTNHFGYWARPLEEADLNPRPGYRDASWPLHLAELNRYYPDANDTGRFGPFNYGDIDFWAEALGGKPFPSHKGDALKAAIFHAQYDRNISDFQVQFGHQLENATNVTVLFNANVLTIESTSDRSHVTGLRCRSIAEGRPERQFWVESRVYVLCQGGIESVRLLKLSDDLGDNAKGQLGRGFMVHPFITTAALVNFDAAVDLLVRNFFKDQEVRLRCATRLNETQAPVPNSIWCPESILESDTLNAFGVLAPTAQTMEAEKIGNFMATLLFESPHTASVDLSWEQVPNENSVIALDPILRDPIFGQPVVRVDWNLLEQDKRTIIKALELCKQYLEGPGRSAARFEITTDLSGGPDHWTFAPGNPRSLQAGDHHMGATRMSKSHDDGIVNSDLQMHSVDNLYIASCAVFPTSGYANPTLTIVALALRLADHLDNKLV